jgi:hypothetical protein
VRAALIAALLALAAGAAAAQSDEEQVQGDWVGVCDNTLVCTGVGFSPERAEGDVGYIRIVRARTGPPQVVLGAEASEEDPTALSVAVVIDGRLVAGVGAVTARRAGQLWRIELTAEEGRALIAAIGRGGRSLELLRGEATLASISLNGAAVTLEYLERAPERRQRVATIVARRPAVNQAGIARRVTRQVLAARRDCEARAAAVRGVYRMAPGQLLWRLSCAGGYNQLDEYVLSDERGRGARLVRLPNTPLRTQDADIYQVSNSRFDVRTGRLAAVMYGRGLGDCGSAWEWAWTGRGFSLVSDHSLGPCRGVPQADWPVRWRAPVSGS